MIKFLADWLLVALVVVSAALLVVGIPRGQRIKRYGYVLMAGLSALFVARLLGALPIGEMRPFVEAGVSAGASYMDNPGFPSDHATLAFTLAFAVIFLTKFRRVGYVLFAVAILISVGRILALVHTPLDIVGGLAAASIGALWCLRFRREKS